MRDPRCKVLRSFFCSTNEDDSRISISLISNSLSNKKTTLSVIYCGYTLYDWVDITIQTRSIDKKLDFEDRYMNENFDSQHLLKDRYDIMKITDQIDSALLLQLEASSLETKSTREVRIELSEGLFCGGVKRVCVTPTKLFLNCYYGKFFTHLLIMRGG